MVLTKFAYVLRTLSMADSIERIEKLSIAECQLDRLLIEKIQSWWFRKKEVGRLRVD